MTDYKKPDGEGDQWKDKHKEKVVRYLTSDEDAAEGELSARPEPSGSYMMQDDPSSKSIGHQQRPSNAELSYQVSTSPQPGWPTESTQHPFHQYRIRTSNIWSHDFFQTGPTTPQSDAPSTFEPEQPTKSQHYRERRIDRASNLIKARYRLINSETNSRLLLDTYSGEVLPPSPEAIAEPVATDYRRQHGAEVRKSEVKNAFGHFQQLTFPIQEAVFFGRAGYNPVTKERYIDAGQYCLSFTANTPMFAFRSGKPFIRPTQSLPLKMHEKVGNVQTQLVEALFDETTLPKDSDLLIIAWMVLSWMPDRAQVMLELIGQPSSSLAQAQDTLKNVLDPATVTLMNEVPRNRIQFHEISHQQYLLSFNWIESLTVAQQNHMYNLMQGIQAPWVWKNKKVGVDINFLRPIVFSSLGGVDKIAKLADVTLSIEVEGNDALGHNLDSISNTSQTILYGFLLIFGKVHAHWRFVEYESRFEHYGGLKDFCRIGELVAKSLGRDPADFWRQFEANQRGRREFELEENPVALAVWQLFEDDGNRVINLAVKDWLKRLGAYRPKGTPPEIWPTTSRKLAAQFRQMQPMLSSLGIEFKPTGRQGPNRYWRAEKASSSADQNDTEE